MLFLLDETVVLTHLVLDDSFLLDDLVELLLQFVESLLDVPAHGQRQAGDVS